MTTNWQELPVETPTGDEVPHGDEPFAGSRMDSPALQRARRRSIALGLALLAVAAVLVVALVRSPTHPWFQGFDDSWRHWMATHQWGPLTTLAKVLSVVGSSWVTAPVRLVAAAVLVVRRRWTQLAAFVSAVVMSELVIGLVKPAIDRPRPPGALVVTTGASFPSGHAIAAAVTAFGLVAAFLPRGRRRWHWFVGATVLAATMAWSRTYLSAHWATDTIGGTCIGVAVALLAEAVFEGGRRIASDV